LKKFCHKKHKIYNLETNTIPNKPDKIRVKSIISYQIKTRAPEAGDRAFLSLGTLFKIGDYRRAPYFKNLLD
jgi:hypothetical protein